MTVSVDDLIARHRHCARMKTALVASADIIAPFKFEVRGAADALIAGWLKR